MIWQVFCLSTIRRGQVHKESSHEKRNPRFMLPHAPGAEIHSRRASHLTGDRVYPSGTDELTLCVTRSFVNIYSWILLGVYMQTYEHASHSKISHHFSFPAGCTDSASPRIEFISATSKRGYHSSRFGCTASTREIHPGGILHVLHAGTFMPSLNEPGIRCKSLEGLHTPGSERSITSIKCKSVALPKTNKLHNQFPVCQKFNIFCEVK